MTPQTHVCDAHVRTDRRLHTQALACNSGGDKPRDHDEEADAQKSNAATLDPEQWKKIASTYLHKEGIKAGTVAPTAHGDESQKRQDYDLGKLLENISVLKSTEPVQDEAGKAAEKPRRTAAMTIGEVVDFLRSENAQEICVINVPPEKQYVQYFVTCSGKGLRHISKIAHSLVDEAKGVATSSRRSIHVEGADSDDWMVVDLGDIVVHLMLPAARNKYQLEKLWTLGPRYDDQFQEVLREMMEAQGVQS